MHVDAFNKVGNRHPWKCLVQLVSALLDKSDVGESIFQTKGARNSRTPEHIWDVENYGGEPVEDEVPTPGNIAVLCSKGQIVDRVVA